METLRGLNSCLKTEIRIVEDKRKIGTVELVNGCRSGVKQSYQICRVHKRQPLWRAFEGSYSNFHQSQFIFFPGANGFW